jgi:branched-chain amino acid transport system ATP-binding protein
VTLALACRNLRSGYGETIILWDVHIEIGSGEVYALMGKNGAGKSTFLKAIIGLLPLLNGNAEVFGQDVSGWPTHRIMATGITYAPQENAFFSDLTVEENLRLGSLALSDRQFRRCLERVIEMFPRIGMRLRQKAGTLSGGEQAMLKVARALLPEPKLVLLDEISEGLQPLAVDRVRQVLRTECRERNVAMLLVEQNLGFVTGLAARYGLIERGQVKGEGSFSEPEASARIDQHLSI